MHFFLTCYYVWFYSEVNIFLSWLILPVFYIYNSIRSRLNLLFHFLLVLLRYSLPFYILTSSVPYFIYSILLFPMLNLLERCSENRFELVFFQTFIFSNKKTGRYFYYFIVSVFFIVLSFFSFDTKVFYMLSIYYFIFRFSSFKLLK